MHQYSCNGLPKEPNDRAQFKGIKRQIILKGQKNHKKNRRLTLTNTQNKYIFRTDCKQNKAYWFQIINLSFTCQNSATFDAKVAEFFIENK